MGEFARINGSQINNQLFAAVVRRDGKVPTPPELKKLVASNGPQADVVHANESDDIARMREFRFELSGKTYRLMRGEFHRHTEISGDGGGDGSLQDMWRYALDAANMDWIGNGDHDNGGGREYTWVDYAKDNRHFSSCTTIRTHVHIRTQRSLSRWTSQRDVRKTRDSHVAATTTSTR